MNSYQYAIDNNVTGTDEEIVDQLIARGVTAAPIELVYLMELLNFRGMLRKTDGNAGDERWKGTLQNIKAALVAMGMTAEVEGFETWFSHVTNPRQSRWDTSRPEYAAQFWAMRVAFADKPGMPTAEDFGAIASLGGGWLFAGLTIEIYQADKLAHETLEAERIAEEEVAQAVRLNVARRNQAYSALLDAARWVESQEQCPTQEALLAYLTPNLPSEE
jgi:hypothetical protein